LDLPNDYEIKDPTYVSKKLSWILRHVALDIGLNMKKDGFIEFDDILNLKCFRGINKDWVVNEIIEKNNKKRFELRTINNIK